MRSNGRLAASAIAIPVLIATALASALWLVLVWWKPTTTWHLAPAIVAGIGAWIAAFHGEQRPPKTVIVGAGLAGLVISWGVLAAISAAGRLQGPALLGDSVVIESAIVAVVGCVGGVIAGLRRASPQ